MKPLSSITGKRLSTEMRIRCGIAVLIAACLFGGYQQLFSTFAAYDDEGYVMLSLDGYQQVGGLYEQVYTQYGPAYYVLQSAFHQITNLPIAHDVSRMRTLLFWSVTCSLAALALWRMTGSRLIASLALVMMFQHLDRLALEPGHPQEWCVLLMVAAWFVSTFVGAAPSSPNCRIAILLGLVCGTLGMIKPNLGVFLTIAVFIALVTMIERSRLQRTLLRMSGIAACLLPWVLLRAKLDEPPALNFALLVSASTFFVLVQCEARKVCFWTISFRTLWVFVAACGASALIFAAAALVTGTSWRGLVEGLVLQHTAFGDRAFYRPVEWPWWTTCWLVTMALLLWCDRRGLNAVRWLRPAIGVLLIATSLVQLLDGGRPLLYGTDDRGLTVLWIVLMCPAAWIALPAGAQRCHWSVMLLAMAAVLQPLGAFPVPGTQMAIGSLLLVALGWYVFHAAITDKELQTSIAPWRPASRQAIGAVLLLTIASLAIRDVLGAARRYQYAPLNLPGSLGLRLPAAQVRELNWIVGQLRARSETFVFRAHTRGSFYYWTQLPPPTWCNATCWPYLLHTHQQQEIVDRLNARVRVCAVDEPYDAPLPVTTSPLLRYIDHRFVPVASNDEFHFRIAEREP